MKRAEIEQLLPSIFRRTVRPGQPLAAVLEVMEALHEPDEEVLSQLETYFHPWQTREDFAAYLSQWVDLGWLLPVTTGSGRLRELIAEAAELAQLRGTSSGLIHFLETATGASGFEIDEEVPGPDDQPKPFHIRIRAPHSTAPHRAMLKRIIEAEKPAFVTYDLEFGQQAQEDD